MSETRIQKGDMVRFKAGARLELPLPDADEPTKRIAWAFHDLEDLRATVVDHDTLGEVLTLRPEPTTDDAHHLINALKAAATVTPADERQRISWHSGSPAVLMLSENIKMLCNECCADAEDAEGYWTRLPDGRVLCHDCLRFTCAACGETKYEATSLCPVCSEAICETCANSRKCPTPHSLNDYLKAQPPGPRVGLYDSYNHDLGTSDRQRLNAALLEAEGAFWAAIAKAYPEATSGDFPPEDDAAFAKSCNVAVREWLLHNTVWLPPVGARVRMKRNLERFPHFNVLAGWEGTVEKSSLADGVTVRFDLYIEGCEEWSNRIFWGESDNAELFDVVHDLEVL